TGARKMITQVLKQSPRLFSMFHRETFCWMGDWFGLMETTTKSELQLIKNSARSQIETT
ncbi:hypothetical protein PRIPAC_79778, partial [Pristionchus pacificus]|uniref:Phosphatidylinositol transfer protein N-terminal domain-containing protein n=1 Tax=Pristionchus pacificus TaxID=54126 RepID=A0A2A6BY64_PRIPA